MASMLEGTPQTASSYVSQTTEYPKWMQDAIYNQIQMSQNVASIPYQAYSLPTVADLTAQQQQAYKNVSAQQGAWNPALTASQQGMGSMAQGTSGTSAAAAQPYMQAAGQTSASQVGQYMDPYQQNVLDTIARQGARNLTENLMPGVSDAFIKSGQFGSSRMGEMGSRAIRDTQEAILNAQSTAAQQGYAQALGASQADLARQAQLGTTAGGLATTDLSRQMTALQQQAALAQQAQQMGYTDTAALEMAGQAQQANQQQNLTAAYNQYLTQQAYPKTQLDWLSTQVRGLTPLSGGTTASSTTNTGQTYSPSGFQQLAAGFSMAKGLQNLLG